MAVLDFERRAIIATGEVQAQLGCPVSFHPGRHPEAPFEIIRLFQEAGGDVEKTVMSHLESELFQMYMNDIQAMIILIIIMHLP
jgi:phosphotriesterase-related protein